MEGSVHVQVALPGTGGHHCEGSSKPIHRGTGTPAQRHGQGLAVHRAETAVLVRQGFE
ncbi:hypothetical protein [Streptomyces sp. NBC_00078]|uniref:hypothetical protein n=1 Tax=unclassified Streptomyces TaxID=2593676 RepID=UPI002257F596|nr:hypothetical protein [Streptomyces sp. NBC_00078]MCX5419001.1 hypothetical protein [Streptomyces sp. NBC_00078]